MRKSIKTFYWITIIFWYHQEFGLFPFVTTSCSKPPFTWFSLNSSSESLSWSEDFFPQQKQKHLNFLRILPPPSGFDSESSESVFLKNIYNILSVLPEMFKIKFKQSSLYLDSEGFKIQILREINFWNCRNAKPAILTHSLKLISRKI